MHAETRTPDVNLTNIICSNLLDHGGGGERLLTTTQKTDNNSDN